MSDIVKSLRDITGEDGDQAGVELCMAAANEIERLRLTDEDRHAIEGAMLFMEARGVWAWPDVLRKLLERTA